MEQIVPFVQKLINSWINDFWLLMPKNAWSFLQVTLSSVKEVYVHILRKWWWLYGTLIISYLFSWQIISNIRSAFPFMESKFPPFTETVLVIIVSIIMANFYAVFSFFAFIPLFIVFLNVCCSERLKSYQSYLSYLNYCFYAYGFLLSILLVVLQIGLIQLHMRSKFIKPIVEYLLLSSNSLLDAMLINPVIFFTLSPFVIFSLFFYLDSDGSMSELMQSAYRAGKMLLFHYPFLFLCSRILDIVLITVQRGFTKMFLAVIHEGLMAQKLGTITMLYVTFPFIICFFNQFFKKKVDEQFNLYFPNNNA